MNKKYTLTEEGLKAIKDEYEQLKIDRDLNIKAIQDNTLACPGSN